MPALNFQKQFATDVETGRKGQTIRAPRKDGRNLKVGDRLYLHTGQRTKACQKLGEGICTYSESISLGSGKYHDKFILAGQKLHGLERILFAHADGFECPVRMLQWFEQVHGLPFEGFCIRWKLI